MAQAERVLREISLTAFSARRRSPELSRSVSEKAESAIPGFATIRGSQPYTHSYRAAAQFDQVIRGVETYVNPSTGQPVELTGGYNRAFTNALGEYILSDSQSFNPNVLRSESAKILSLSSILQPPPTNSC